MNNEQITEGNMLIAIFMGAISVEEDHTGYNADGTIKYTPNEDGSKWFITTWSKPNGITDEIYKRWGWGDYTMGKWHYHSSWDWLMPVVEKIESLDFYVWIMYSEYNDVGKINQVSINGMDIPFPSGKSKCSIVEQDGNKINATYRAVTRFIKWHNSNILSDAHQI